MMEDLLRGSVPLDQVVTGKQFGQTANSVPDERVWRVFYTAVIAGGTKNLSHSVGPFTMEEAQAQRRNISNYEGMRDVRIGQSALYTCRTAAQILKVGTKLRVEQSPVGEPHIVAGEVIGLLHKGGPSGWILCEYYQHNTRVLTGTDWRFTIAEP